jgi:hypothetical protein
LPTVGRRHNQRRAGECFSETGDLKSAGDSYRMAEKFYDAARSYQEGGFVDEMVKVINLHRNAFENDILEQMITFARIHYFKVYFTYWFVPEYP